MNGGHTTERLLIAGVVALVVAPLAWLVGNRTADEAAPSLREAPNAEAPGATTSSTTSPPATSSSSTVEPTTTSTTAGITDEPLLPDPWSVDDRFDCYGGTTADIARCSRYDLAAATANLHTTVEVLVRGADIPELRDLQSAWSSEVDTLCAMSTVGGSMDRFGLPHCYRKAAEARAAFLPEVDPWGRLPTNPVDLWGTPAGDFDAASCAVRLIGEVRAKPTGATLVSATSEAELRIDEFGRVTGNVRYMGQLETTDGTLLEVEADEQLYGRKHLDVAAGVFVSEARWSDEEAITGYGYWWVEIVDGGGTGEMLALFESDAVSILQFETAAC